MKSEDMKSEDNNMNIMSVKPLKPGLLLILVAEIEKNNAW